MTIRVTAVSLATGDISLDIIIIIIIIIIICSSSRSRKSSY